MMFMMSPGIVLFCALFHLAFDWVGFIRVMIRKCLFYGELQMYYVYADT